MGFLPLYIAQDELCVRYESRSAVRDAESIPVPELHIGVTINLQHVGHVGMSKSAVRPRELHCCRSLALRTVASSCSAQLLLAYPSSSYRSAACGPCGVVWYLAQSSRRLRDPTQMVGGWFRRMLWWGCQRSSSTCRIGSCSHHIASITWQHKTCLCAWFVY